MPYVGNKPEVGNFRKCDAITTSATATYNLLVGGVAVNPNQNQCIVSLNGVIQSSGTSYTIASSQITFASALTSSDVIDFILILGDTLDVGTVSDDTIGLAQLSATGTASSSTYLRGDNSWQTVSGTTINNNADNRVITGSGTANTLEGESNLTYDGTTFQLSQASPILKILPTTNGNDGVLEICGRSTDGSPTENRTQIKGEAEGSTANTRMSFHVENASGVNERMRIDSSGNIFLGVTSASGFNGSTFKVPDGYSIYRNTSTGGNGILLFYSDDGGTAVNKGYYTANGGLANYQSNNVNLSDERLKKDIVDCPSTWDKIKNLKVRNFKYKDDTNERVVTGLIAQETETVDTNLVNSENGLYGYEEEQKDGKYKQIYTTDLYHQMLKALQEAQTKIETLETENTDIKARLTALENK